MNRVAVVDTGVSNIHSISRALEECGAEIVVTRDPADLDGAARIVLPGVGSFPRAMAVLTSSGMAGALHAQVIDGGVPFLGICLGMQVMATRGFERSETAGLGWIEGDVKLLQPGPAERVPHVGWNTVSATRESPLFNGIAGTHDFYFVHSYALAPAHEDDVIATTDFAGGLPAAVERGHIFGVQFHPEKSQRAGFEVLRNFLAY
jgi:glutamine amidotransferase